MQIASQQNFSDQGVVVDVRNISNFKILLVNQIVQ